MKKIVGFIFGLGCLSLVGGCFSSAYALYSGTLPTNKELAIGIEIVAPTTSTYYLKTQFPNGTDDWDQWDSEKDRGAQRIFAHVWNATDEDDIEMSWDHDRIWKLVVPINTYTSVLFCRVNPDAESFAWDKVYNQTDNLAFVANKDTAQITSWSGGTDGHSTVQWIS